MQEGTDFYAMQSERVGEVDAPMPYRMIVVLRWQRRLNAFHTRGCGLCVCACMRGSQQFPCVVLLSVCLSLGACSCGLQLMAWTIMCTSWLYTWATCQYPCSVVVAVSGREFCPGCNMGGACRDPSVTKGSSPSPGRHRPFARAVGPEWWGEAWPVVGQGRRALGQGRPGRLACGGEGPAVPLWQPRRGHGGRAATEVQAVVPPDVEGARPCLSVRVSSR